TCRPAALAPLRAGHPVVSSLAAGARRAGSERWARYVQFAVLGPSLRAEGVGIQYLQGRDRLTPEQLANLDRLGWNAPDDSGNHWRWFDPRDHLDAARLAVTTLHMVHGVDHPRQLTFDCGPARPRPAEAAAVTAPPPPSPVVLASATTAPAP